MRSELYPASIDPRLGPLQDNGGPTQTHAPLTGSPLIDHGSPAAPGSGNGACEATDQRGTTRPGPGTVCDIGAVEDGTSETADLAVEKTTSTSGYIGEPVEYRITVVNTGGAAATGVVITDPVPASQMTVTSATVDQGSCTVTGNLVSCAVGVLGPGQRATAVVTARPLAGGVLSNSASVTADAGSGVPADGIAASADLLTRTPIQVTTTAEVAGGPTDCTLSDAITAHNTGQAVNACHAGSGRDLILLPAGTYMFSVGFADPANGPAALPGIRRRLEIRGAGSGTTVITRGPDAADMRFFSNAGGELWLEGMTLTGGKAANFSGSNASFNGGAIFGGAVHLTDVVLDGNTAPVGHGGAIYAGLVEATNTVFRNNAADTGNGGGCTGR